jgi:hypothetical protein
VGSGVDELTKVLVLGEQHTRIVNSPLDDLGILDRRRDLGYGHDIVAGRTEGPDDREVATLVRQETHRLSAPRR